MFALRNESMSTGLVMVSRNVLNGIRPLEIRNILKSIVLYFSFAKLFFFLLIYMFLCQMFSCHDLFRDQFAIHRS